MIFNEVILVFLCHIWCMYHHTALLKDLGLVYDGLEQQLIDI